MGKVVSNFFISLDGVVEAPDQWHFAYFDGEMGQAVGVGTQSCGAFLMGQEMYDQWSEYWPAQGDDDFGGFINHIRRYVVSSTLQDPAWTNTSVVPGDADAIRALKAEVDGDIGMSGSTTTVRWLSRRGWSTSCTCFCTRSRSGRASGCSPGGRRTRCDWSAPRHSGAACCTSSTPPPDRVAHYDRQRGHPDHAEHPQCRLRAAGRGGGADRQRRLGARRRDGQPLRAQPDLWTDDGGGALPGH